MIATTGGFVGTATRAWRRTTIVTATALAVMTGQVHATEGSAPKATGEAPAAAVVPAANAEIEAAKALTESDIVTESFADWALICPKDKAREGDGNGKIGCRLIQSAVLKADEKDGADATPKRIMLTAVGYSGEEKQPVVNFVVPLGILLSPGVLLDVDGYDQLTLAIQRCDANGCVAMLPMKELLIEAFRKGNEGSVTFFNVAGKPNKIRISLKGFAAGVAALAKHKP